MLHLLRDAFWYVGSIQLGIWMTEITHLMMDDLRLSDFSYICCHSGAYFLLIKICRSSWSHDPHHSRDACQVDILLLSYHDPLVEYFLGHSIRLTLSTFRYHYASSSRRRFFDLWIRFNCGHGWLGLHTWWWVIWCHLIFWPTTHLMPYWGIFPFWLRFVEFHWFAWSSPVTRYTPSWWFAFILSWFSSWAFLESFSQACAFWHCRDSWTKLSQVHRLPYHHFSGVHVKSLIHPMEQFSSH